MGRPITIDETNAPRKTVTLTVDNPESVRRVATAVSSELGLDCDLRSAQRILRIMGDL